MMNQVKRNVIANFVGKAWNAMILFALIPQYIRILGIEAYGLIGFFTTLQIVFSLLDMGLSTTLNREIARLSVQTDSGQEIRDLLRTLEIIYWLMAVLIIIVMLIIVPPIATYWVNAQHLTSSVIRQSISLIGVMIAFEFPFALYSGGLIGLQRQIMLNILTIVTVTLRGLGSILVLLLFSPTIQVFFAWSAVIVFLQTLFGAIFLWNSLPKAPNRARFRYSLLAKIWRFAAGMTGISVLSVLLTQLDKIILSKILTLEEFGYYSLAAVVSSGLYMIITPIFTALFPRLSQMVSGDDNDLVAIYHNGCQLMSVFLISAAVILVLFSKQILLIWTQSEFISDQTYVILDLLAIGTALNGLMTIPYALQIAYGWTKLAFYQNLVAVIILFPTIFLTTHYYGAIGAASIWVVLNASYVLIGIHLMHRRLLQTEKLRWFVQDIGLPLLATFAVALVGRWLLPIRASTITIIIWLLSISALTFLASALVTPFTYRRIKAFLF